MSRHANYKDRTRRARRQKREKKEQPPLLIDEKFGLCPQCRAPGGTFVRVGKDCWIGCLQHRVAWFVADVSGELRGPGAKPDSILAYAEVSPVFSSETHPARLVGGV